MFFKTEEKVRKGKNVLEVTPRTKPLVIFFVLILIISLALGYFAATGSVEAKMISIGIGVAFGLVYGLKYKNERTKIISRKKEGTDIIVQDPNKRSGKFWIEI